MTQYAKPPKLTVAPAALVFTNPVVLDYWREELRLNCAVSLDRLREICAARGASVETTVRGLEPK